MINITVLSEAANHKLLNHQEIYECNAHYSWPLFQEIGATIELKNTEDNIQILKQQQAATKP
jgi:hypothetical protein